MVSKEGIMPEGDFYYPFPYQPQTVFSADAVDAEVNKGRHELLERLFRLLCDELEKSDPEYLGALGQDAHSVGGFHDAYFRRRK